MYEYDEQQRSGTIPGVMWGYVVEEKFRAKSPLPAKREREKERGEIKTTMEIQTRSYWDFMNSIHHTTHAHHPHDHMHNMTDGNRRDATWGWKMGRGGTYRTYIRTTGKIVSNLGEICNIYYSQQRALARTSHTNSYRRTVEHGRY